MSSLSTSKRLLSLTVWKAQAIQESARVIIQSSFKLGSDRRGLTWGVIILSSNKRVGSNEANRGKSECDSRETHGEM